jgi:hypothetical protein
MQIYNYKGIIPTCASLFAPSHEWIVLAWLHFAGRQCIVQNYAQKHSCTNFQEGIAYVSKVFFQTKENF